MADETEPGSAPDDALLRFPLATRVFHWVNAALSLILVVTGVVIWLPALASFVGNRGVVRAVHVWTGLGLAACVAAMVLGPWGGPIRDDLRRVQWMDGDDRRWLRGVSGPDGDRPPQGKFNAGQKVNAAWTAAALIVFVVTGVSMRWYSSFPSWWVHGCNTVHDLAFFVFTVGVVAHILLAVAHPTALRAMVTGYAPASWAATRHRKWAMARVTAPDETMRNDREGRETDAADEPRVGANPGGDRAVN